MPVLYGIGILLSGAFVVTWFPLAFKAWWRLGGSVAIHRIMDHSGLQLCVLLAFSMVLHDITNSGIESPSGPWAVLGRIILISGIDLIVAIRAARWFHLLWVHRKDRDHGAAVLSGVSRQLEEPQSSP